MIDHRLSRTNLVTLVIVLGLPAAAAEARKAWDFTAEKIDATPKGFTAAAGNWQVVNEGPNKVLAQRAKSEDDVFNVVLIDFGESDCWCWHVVLMVQKILGIRSRWSRCSTPLDPPKCHPKRVTPVCSAPLRCG